MRGIGRARKPSQREFIPLSRATVGREYRVRNVLRPQNGFRLRCPWFRAPRAAEARSSITLRSPQPSRHLSDSAWKATQVRLAELGIWPGQTIEKSGSAGPGCPIILKVGGSRVALSPDLCDLIIVRPV